MVRTVGRLRTPRLRFSLSITLAAIALVGLAIGWHVSLVHRRMAMRAWILENGGSILLRSRMDEPLGFDRHGKKVITGLYDLVGPDDLSVLRRWLGDEPVTLVELASEERIAEIRSLFPEAGVRRGMTEWGPIILDCPSIECESNDN